jgi:hypothetical protein
MDELYAHSKKPGSRTKLRGKTPPIMPREASALRRGKGPGGVALEAAFAHAPLEGSRLRELEVDLGTLVSSVTCEEVCS